MDATLEQPLSEAELVVNIGAESSYSSETGVWISEEAAANQKRRMLASGRVGRSGTKGAGAPSTPPPALGSSAALGLSQNTNKLQKRKKGENHHVIKAPEKCAKNRPSVNSKKKNLRSNQEGKENLSFPGTKGNPAFPPAPPEIREEKSPANYYKNQTVFEDMSNYSATKLHCTSNGTNPHQGSNGEVMTPFHPSEWEYQVRQFQRFLRWQHYQQMAHEQRLEDQATLCGMFRVLAQFIHALGTLLLITGLICQLISIVSSKWISHFLTSDASVVYYEGLWHRCTQQAATPISQWACWNWRGFSNGQKLDENSTPISVLGARVLLISAIICSSLGSAIVWLACKCSVLIQDGAKPCVLLLTGALACISGILSGTGVTWRAIQVLKMSNSFYNQETISNSNDELAISFDSGVWFGWASMVFLVIAGVILALASRLLQPRRSYPLHSTITQPVSRYTEYL